MSIKVSLCALLLGAALAAHAETRVQTVPGIQDIELPNPDFSLSPGRVAINGDLAIVIEDFGSLRQARPYQRMASGQWQSGPVLFAVGSPPKTPDQDDVAMGN